MLPRLIWIVGLLALFQAAPAAAQSLDPEAEKAARELMTTIKLADQFSAMLPMVFKAMKPAIVQNRPDFDALLPVLQQKMTARVSELDGSGGGDLCR